MSGLLAAYAEKIAMGELRSDPAQAELVGLLNTLANALEARERRGFLGKLLAPQQPPRGIYIYGDVGRGKTC